MPTRGAHWQEFSQEEKLTTRIANILGDYPAGPTVIKELLQNADDAGAREFALFLDAEPAPIPPSAAPAFPPDPREGTAAAAAAILTHPSPSLYVFNSAVFTEDDLRSICSIGQSGKRADPTKIGKYGLGFNASFHLADTVSFVSRGEYVTFDPHGRDLPGGVLGLRSPWLQEGLADAAEVAPLLDAARNVFGAVVNTKIHIEDDAAAASGYGHGSQHNLCLEAKEMGLNGTVFRLPLRTAEQAKASLLSDGYYTPDRVRAMLDQFAADAVECLLFLKSVERLQVYVRNRGGDGTVELLHNVRLVGMSEATRKRRNFVRLLHRGGSSLSSGGTSCSGGSSSSSSCNCVGPRATTRLVVRHGDNREQTWLVHCGADTSDTMQDLAERFNEMAVGGVAARVDDDFRGGEKLNQKQEEESGITAVAVAAARVLPTPACNGRAYCYLPLPVQTGLPVHCHASFALSSNRRTLWQQREEELLGPDGAETMAYTKGRWNDALVTQLLPQLYAELLLLLRDYKDDKSLMSEADGEGRGRHDARRSKDRRHLVVPAQKLAAQAKARANLLYTRYWPDLKVLRDPGHFGKLARALLRRVAGSSSSSSSSSTITTKTEQQISSSDSCHFKIESGAALLWHEAQAQWIIPMAATVLDGTLMALGRKYGDGNGLDDLCYLLGSSKAKTTVNVCSVPDTVVEGFQEAGVALRTATPTAIAVSLCGVEMSAAAANLLLLYQLEASVTMSTATATASTTAAAATTTTTIATTATAAAATAPPSSPSQPIFSHSTSAPPPLLASKAGTNDQPMPSLARRVSGLHFVPYRVKGRLRFGALKVDEDAEMERPFVMLQRPEDEPLVKGYHRLVDTAALPSLPRLLAALRMHVTNIDLLTASALLDIGLELFLPTDWCGRPCAPLEGANETQYKQEVTMQCMRAPSAVGRKSGLGRESGDGRGDGAGYGEKKESKGKGGGKKTWSKGKKSKGKRAKVGGGGGSKKAQAGEVHTAKPVLLTADESHDLVKRLGLFWDLVRTAQSISTVCARLSIVPWPLIVTTSGWVVSPMHARARLALLPSDWSPCDRDLLEYFGVLLLMPADKNYPGSNSSSDEESASEACSSEDEDGVRAPIAAAGKQPLQNEQRRRRQQQPHTQLVPPMDVVWETNGASLFGMRRLISALANNSHFVSNPSHERCLALRSALLRWCRTQPNAIRQCKHEVQQLPVFRVLGSPSATTSTESEQHACYVRIVNEAAPSPTALIDGGGSGGGSDGKSFSCGTTAFFWPTPASEGGGAWQPHSIWDDLLGPTHGDALLSLAQEEERDILAKVDFLRPAHAVFLHAWALPRLDDPNLCPESLIYIMAALAECDMLGESRVLRALRASRVVAVPLPSGRIDRRLCRHFIDPSDTVLSSIFEAVEAAALAAAAESPLVNEAIASDTGPVTAAINTAGGSGNGDMYNGNGFHSTRTLPPSEYSNNPLVLKAMRAAGMASLHDAETFLAAAQSVARLKLAKEGRQLCRLLVEHVGKKGWTASQLLAILSVPFVPAMDARQCGHLFGLGSTSPQGATAMLSAVRQVMGQLSQGSTVAPSRLTHRQKGGTGMGQHNLARMAEEELAHDRDDSKEANQVDGGSGGGSSGGGSGSGSSLSSSKAAASAEDFSALVRQGLSMMRDDATATSTTRRQQGDSAAQPTPTTVFIAPASNGMLSAFAFATWTQRYILPAAFNRAPRRLLVHLFPHIAKGRPLVEGEVALRHLTAMAKRWDWQPELAPLLVQQRQGLVLCASALAAAELRAGRLRTHTACRLLCKVPFVVLDDGRGVLPSAVCLDLDQSLSRNLVNPPAYLRKLGPFLGAIGSPSLADVHAPPALVRGRPPKHYRRERIEALCNTDTLSDFRLVSAQTGRTFYGHRLIFALASPYWMTMFATAGMAEASSAARIELPDWLSDAATKMIFAYVYHSKDPLNTHLPITDTTVSSVLELLRAADLYRLTHLASTCEVWLIDNEILDIYNVTGLLSHAVGCHAPQLRAHCVALCRAMFDVISATQEWAQLPEDVRALVVDYR
eukprot:UC1_evm1s82